MRAVMTVGRGGRVSVEASGHDATVRLRSRRPFSVGAGGVLMLGRTRACRRRSTCTAGALCT